MTEYPVCDVEEVPDRGNVLVELEGKQIAIFERDDEHYAYTNWCPHQSGPICEGDLDGTVERSFDRDTLAYNYEWVMEDSVLRCPWHAWEFDIESGECLHDSRIKLISHPVSVENGTITISL